MSSLTPRNFAVACQSVNLAQQRHRSTILHTRLATSTSFLSLSSGYHFYPFRSPPRSRHIVTAHHGWPFSSSKSADASSSSSSTQPAFEAVAPAPVDTTVNTTPSSDNPTDYLRSHTFQQPSSPSSSTSGAGAEYVPNAASLLGDSSLDLGSLSPLAGLGKDDLEYLDLTDGAPSSMEGARTAVPSRGWSDDLCYGTGTTYLSGLALGGLLGAREGFFRPLGVDNPTFRLRLNAVLNQVTRRGPSSATRLASSL